MIGLEIVLITQWSSQQHFMYLFVISVKILIFVIGGSLRRPSRFHMQLDTYWGVEPFVYCWTSPRAILLRALLHFISLRKKFAPKNLPNRVFIVFDGLYVMWLSGCICMYDNTWKSTLRNDNLFKWDCQANSGGNNHTFNM